MIFTYILNSLQGVVLWVISLFPNVTFTVPSLSGLASGIGIIKYILTPAVFTTVLAYLCLMIVAQPAVSLVKFIYRKIPGIS